MKKPGHSTLHYNSSLLTDSICRFIDPSLNNCYCGRRFTASKAKAMKTASLVKKFNYSIVPSLLASSAVMEDEQPGCKDASLVNIDIDFEHEGFKLEGDWKYMMASNKHAEKKWFACHDQRISIEASICPGLTIDLSDDNNDGLVFVIEGIIKDKDITNACSGLLVLDKLITDSDMDAGKWNISFYLYDNAHDDCEIAFKFPVYGHPANDLLN